MLSKSYYFNKNGLKEIPDGGESFYVVKNEKIAQLICSIKAANRQKTMNPKDEI
jgi:hypothetical protein